jgi:hypothetical protein
MASLAEEDKLAWVWMEDNPWGGNQSGLRRDTQQGNSELVRVEVPETLSAFEQPPAVRVVVSAYLVSALGSVAPRASYAKTHHCNCLQILIG